ncbi:hypothetical protein PInf_024169 [Phytophthora infestans]|nr:hypothetical protein PInf_024169 [Phytophthora infestans]
MPSKPRALRVGNLTEGEKMQLYDKHKREPKLTQNQLAEWCRVKFSLEKAPVQVKSSSHEPRTRCRSCSLG